MDSQIPSTYFAPAQRTPPEELQAQNVRLQANLVLVKMLNCFPDAAIILNDQRQIVLANDKFAQLLGRSPAKLLGLRVGEALGCVHADEEPAGCGTTQSCRFCGAAQAMVASIETRTAQIRECRIACTGNSHLSGLDLWVSATPLPMEEEIFTVFSVRDIADEKRRLVLERLFFHDLLNEAGGMHGILELWSELSGQEAVQVQEMARNLARQMLEEIETQRNLSAAENGDLSVQYKTVHAAELLAQLTFIYRHHTVAVGKNLVQSSCRGWPCMQTDETLLRHALAALIKNALEASTTGQAVTIGFHNQGIPTFTVHNEGVMPEEVQRQIFQRSFSTKEGKGRGIGSYSVKLLLEKYLHGTVAFCSSPDTGTVFTVRLPA